MKIGTHNGLFHADDVFAVAALRRIMPNATIIRSRNPCALSTCDIRVDIGGEYAPDKGTYDHHQIGGAGERDNGVPFASFGLVWKHFGSSVCGGSDEVARLVDESLVQPVDAWDNGFALYEVERIRDVRPYTVSEAIFAINPCWHESSRDFDDAFDRAVIVATSILEREILRAEAEVLAGEAVRTAIAQASDPRILILEQSYPWKREVVKSAKNIQLVISFVEESKYWRIQTVPMEPSHHSMRCLFPEIWAGKEGAELQQITCVPDAVFCHRNRFIAAARSKEGALQMAKNALHYRRLEE